MTKDVAQHAPDRMVNVYNRMCRAESSDKKPSFTAADSKTAEYCAEHAPEGAVYVKNRKCRVESCGK